MGAFVYNSGMRYAVVKKGKVINVIVYDGKSKYRPDGDLIELPEDSTVATGYTYKDGEFTPPKS